ncbi:MAG: type II and III secretion system protein, partial [Bryobacteraceae bacterium]
HSLEAATGTFVIPISEKLIMAAKDTPQKRQELEPTVAVVIAVPNTVAIQEAQELVRTVQQTFDIQKMMLDSEQRLLLVRDRLSKVYPAEKVLEQLIVYSGQVHVDVEFVAVNKRASYTYGLRLQQIFNLYPIINKNPTSYLARLLGGAASIGLVIADSGIFASMSKSDARTILQTEVTSLDGKAATIHIGDKYPIISSGYYGAGSTSGGNQYTPPPTFNFEDLGVVVKLTPFIHGTDDITVEVEAEYKVLTGAVTDGIPVIANRKIQSRVRLADGQSGVIAGLITSSRSRGWNGLAGVASLPVVGPFLRENTRDRDDEEVIMVIKPTLVGLPPGELGMKPVWVGSETRPLSWL